MRYLFLILVLAFTFACRSDPPPAANVASPEAQQINPEQRPLFANDSRALEINSRKNLIREFFTPMGKPTEYEWLYTMKEAGQTFPEYVNANPTRLTDERRFIYILPAGKFSAAERLVIQRVAKYMRAFFGVEVKMLGEVSLNLVPANRRRKNPYDGTPQVHSAWFLDDLLPPRLPQDAAALICLTSTDLYPSDDWNFVFGQAYLQLRVGVYSLARLGNAGGTADERKLFLEGALKISMHETGHMFSIQHCKAYVCFMSGSMGLHETDLQPLDACPECAAKLAWAFEFDPAVRYRRLAEFCREVGWNDEAGKFDDKALKFENSR